MAQSDAYDITIGSDLFLYICQEMNAISPDPNASWGFDGMSGGFKFSDEGPESLKANQQAVLPFISLLRYLWAYRQSIVCGHPRSNLEAWWEATKSLAPNWPGFLPERCSTVMRPTADECIERGNRLAEDLDELDRRYSANRNSRGPASQ